MYEQEISRRNPGCFLFLLDQSYSMGAAISGSPAAKKSALASMINELLYAVVLECTKDFQELPRHYFDVGVVGYSGAGVLPLLPGTSRRRVLVPVHEYAGTGRPVEHSRTLRRSDGTVEQELTTVPEWIQPANWGRTPMCEALDLAHKVLRGWVKAHRTSFPPIVLNITDGQATDGDPRRPAHRVTRLETGDGSTLLFNLHLSEAQGTSLPFPVHPPSGVPQAQLLFEMSSVLPGTLVQASGYGDRIEPGARGFVFNGGATSLMDFLRIGTSTTSLIGEH
ncbi:vWA domain-containing protein [Streptomyces sp. NPDC001795]|uniref:vWA domain-containing protein n=1 Tax=Streptomyces sp. NPDC001795 TaxID=3154525 RepID=UPI0033210D0E